MNVLVTGSAGLIGSEAALFFDSLGFAVEGIDNNQRADFFGAAGDTTWNRKRLEADCRTYRHWDLDIRDRAAILDLFQRVRFDLVVHAAAQPSHDLAADRPFDDFDINAVGTLNLLEATRKHAAEAVFLYLSTNKVYGDGPNRIRLRELETRWEYEDARYLEGIPEDFPVDHCMHSLFGVSKLAGDLMTQEYGRYFGMKTGVFRGGCLTGPQHAGVEMHGFLSYLILTTLTEGPYQIFGYGGKQVRDQIHSSDVVRALWEFAQDPKPGEVYNLGGGKENAASLLECIDLIEQVSHKRARLSYTDQNRQGDHICYYSDLRKFRSHFPSWQLTYNLERIVHEMVGELSERVGI